ncbi:MULTISPECIES: polysaccharide pyruvyl transferase family protein [unclassified Ruminococcus]|uniref:polysaccharide pyruvyl transferase family protein n=1 Tax=unclassified Ruminococcus TaxID=2608920 RepID=UPI00189750EF|nr:MULTISPECIES: polysaccharide pyruvyl transferase family protein [unclassified Ruminococcus]MDB8778162.1 polysaccharide pyruvyl transferase family protein [Ruminococcus sp. 1001136sp1]MDB8785515.1 polysaccharide pyruvyl transferase family protein [Ruminococcus sp. 1001136sp1]
MKKIFLWGYWAKNFGDDLFLKVYLDQMKEANINTYILTEKKYKKFYEEMGVKVVSKDSFIYKLSYKILTMCRKPELYFWLVNKRSLFVLLGGSLFAENKGTLAEQKQFLNLDYATTKAEKSFVIGSNFGPYIHEKFKKEYEALFGEMEDVVFRDKMSYELFNKTLKNVRYAPDIAFEGRWEENKKSSNSIVISVINVEHRQELATHKEIYEKGIADICLYHIHRNEKVFLLSLCEQEGDILACQRIYEMLNQQDKRFIEMINYNSIDRTIELLASAKKIYATRFHALMMALYFHKNVVPIIYNEKGINAIESYCRSLKWFSIENFNEDTLLQMTKIDQTAELELPDSKQFQGLLKYCRIGWCDNDI